ncbi:MAG: protein kinase domain-containing protein [Actinomycetota bacterium]
MRTDPRVGTELAGHQILAVIGRGGMAVVYLAEHLRLGRKVALKILGPELAEDEAFRARFTRESRIAAGLDHPNIVTVYDAGEADGILYISMRYVAGTDLERLLRSETNLDPAWAVSIASQCAAALDAAHAQGLVHRDVKPANILLAPDRHTSTDRVYLSDFGVTKRLHSGAGLTRTGQFVGTVDYVAPEQIQGEVLDGRADVYSLGCVLYRCLTGDVPFPRDTEVGTIYAHLEDNAPSPSERRPELPSRLDEVLARALAKSPGERFGTCRGLAEAAAEAIGPPALSEEPVIRFPAEVSAGAPLPSHRARRRLVWFALVGMAGVVAVTMTAALVLPLFGSEPVREGSESPTPGGSVSPDPDAMLQLAWNAVPDIQGVFGGPGDQAIAAAVVGVDGTIVAVGYDGAGEDGNAAVWTSSNGTRWTLAESEALGGSGGQRMEDVAIIDGELVAVGSESSSGDVDPAVWAFSDAATWRKLDPITSGLHETRNQAMRAVIEAPSGLVAVGHDNSSGSIDAAVWTSEDGTTWIRQTSSFFGGRGHDDMVGMTAFGEELVVVGFGTTDAGDRNAAVWVESGGLWSRIEDGSLGGEGDQQMTAVLAGGPGLVAVGFDYSRGDQDAAVWTSADGRNWDRAPTQAGFDGPGVQTLDTLVQVGSALVAGGSSDTPTGDSNGAIWLSSDGTNWTRLAPASPAAAALGGLGRQWINSLVVFGRRLLAVGSERGPQSDQAAGWITDPFPAPS